MYDCSVGKITFSSLINVQEGYEFAKSYTFHVLIQEGEVVETKGYELAASYVFHAVIPIGDEPEETQEHILQT